ncbi:MAG: helix-turn-helix domain-containing protein [Actinobacteria bacterium]|jgi:predicted DNA-binding transcriptional regulator AlpA|nr:helix-turn-helix domain-containing protein [Actinomycetota bacterium]
MAPLQTQLLTQEQVAAEYGLSPSWLERKRCSGDGPRFVKLGEGRFASVRYRRCDLEAYIEGCVRQSTSDPGPQS